MMRGLVGSIRATAITTKGRTMITGTPEKIAADRDARTTNSRESTKRTVALAEQVMAKARYDGYVPSQDAEWLFETAKSLAGSVISQADPTD